MKVNQLDATDLFCPEFSLPVRQFLNALEEDEQGHIVTKEKRAVVRLQHICKVYEWQLKGPVPEGDLIHFIVSKT